MSILSVLALSAYVLADGQVTCPENKVHLTMSAEKGKLWVNNQEKDYVISKNSRDVIYPKSSDAYVFMHFSGCASVDNSGKYTIDPYTNFGATISLKPIHNSGYEPSNSYEIELNAIDVYPPRCICTDDRYLYVRVENSPGVPSYACGLPMIGGSDMYGVNVEYINVDKLVRDNILSEEDRLQLDLSYYSKAEKDPYSPSCQSSVTTTSSTTTITTTTTISSSTTTANNITSTATTTVAQVTTSFYLPGTSCPVNSTSTTTFVASKATQNSTSPKVLGYSGVQKDGFVANLLIPGFVTFVFAMFL